MPEIKRGRIALDHWSCSVDLKEVDDNGSVKTYLADPEELQQVYGFVKDRNEMDQKEYRDILKASKQKTIYQQQLEAKRRAGTAAQVERWDKIRSEQE